MGKNKHMHTYLHIVRINCKIHTQISLMPLRCHVVENIRKENERHPYLDRMMRNVHEVLKKCQNNHFNGCEQTINKDSDLHQYI